MPQQEQRLLEGVRVLLVEDCPDQQRLMVKILEYGGANVTLECNGSAAVNRIKRTPDGFDVIIMDFFMPLTDGLEATRLIREDGNLTPVIAVTAHHSDHLETMWQMFGCNAYLRKPLNPREVQEIVASLAVQSVRSEA